MFMVVAIVPAILMKGACKLVVAPSVILLWSFIVYATALGNGLSNKGLWNKQGNICVKLNHLTTSVWR